MTPEHPPRHPSLNTQRQGPSEQCGDSQGLHSQVHLPLLTGCPADGQASLPRGRAALPSMSVLDRPQLPLQKASVGGTLISRSHPREHGVTTAISSPS